MKLPEAPAAKPSPQTAKPMVEEPAKEPKAETPVVEKKAPPEPAPQTSPPKEPAKLAMPSKADQDRVTKQLEDATPL